jgi:hypothetical protein
MGEMTQFLEHTKREQQTRLCGSLPSMKEYWSYRAGTSAVGVIVAVLECVFETTDFAMAWILKACRYAMQVRLGDSVVSGDERIHTITTETIRNIVMSVVV